jgi:hypothetical protein
MPNPLAFAALMLAPPAEPIVLDDLIVFADRARCMPAPAFGRILDKLWAVRSDGRPGLHEAVPKAYRGAFVGVWGIYGNNGAADMIADVNGTWHGLRLTSITLLSRPWEPGLRLELRIAAPGERTRAVLGPLGFRFSPERDDARTALGVPMHERGTTVLTCKPPHG